MDMLVYLVVPNRSWIPYVSHTLSTTYINIIWTQNVLKADSGTDVPAKLFVAAQTYFWNKVEEGAYKKAKYLHWIPQLWTDPPQANSTPIEIHLYSPYN